MSACAAMASASSANARKDHTVAATWWAASGTSPSPAATHVVSEEDRPQREGAHEQRYAAEPGPQHPAGVRRAAWPRPGAACATRTTTRPIAMPVWAMTVPHADPAMPQPNP